MIEYLGPGDWELLDNEDPVGHVRVLRATHEGCAVGCGAVLEMAPGEVVPVMRYPALHLGGPDPLCQSCAERHLAGWAPCYGHDLDGRDVEGLDGRPLEWHRADERSR